MFCAGVVIDDLVMLAYAEAGLPTNPKKAFYNSSAASFWGVSVDGVKGTI